MDGGDAPSAGEGIASYAPVSLSGAWRESFGICSRYRLALVVPAAALGVLGNAELLTEHSGPTLQLISSAVALPAFFLFVGYAEEIALEAGRGADRISVSRALRRAGPNVAPLAVASVIVATAVLLGLIALVLPGLWLLTRLSLVPSVVCAESRGPIDAIRRSSRLVRGRFRAVFGSATAAILLDQLADAVLGDLVPHAFDAPDWVALLAGTIVATFVTPPLALVVSIVYARLAGHERLRRADDALVAKA